MRTGPATRPGACLLAAAGLLAFAGNAAAELVYFKSGRTMSVKSAERRGETIALQLRTGGEIVCDADLVEKIAPDEVPYPEERAVAAPAGAAVAAGPWAGGGATAYAALISELAAAEGVDANLIHAVVSVESAYQPTARSPKGAMGLMQLMPTTARQYRVSDPYDPRANLQAGIQHLRSLLDRFDLSLALAAYNAGVAAVEKYGGIPPYPETQAYVRRILRRLSPG